MFVGFAYSCFEVTWCKLGVLHTGFCGLLFFLVGFDESSACGNLIVVIWVVWVML